MLSDLPSTLLPAAFAAECARRIFPNERTRFLSDAVAYSALAGGLAAMAAGWIDWLTMPAEHAAKKPATTHGLINSTSMVATGASAVMPAHRLVLLGIAAAGVTVGSWIGGDLVFRFGWRVRPAEEAEIVQGRLSREGRPSYFAEAAQEVDEFERKRTILGG